ncbi:MAG: hypothetical protein VYD90_05350 [Pseudomonadota bacterium]|nr:hypothetical protein [Pseudomonadota bacterium]
MATFRHSGSWAVPQSCYCLFVSSGAVAIRYPIDGIPEFAKDFAPVIEKGKTLMVLVFTEAELADKIERLDYRGLIPGRNMAMTNRQVSTAEQKSALGRRKTRPSCYMPGGSGVRA